VLWAWPLLLAWRLQPALGLRAPLVRRSGSAARWAAAPARCGRAAGRGRATWGVRRRCSGAVQRRGAALLRPPGRCGGEVRRCSGAVQRRLARCVRARCWGWFASGWRLVPWQLPLQLCWRPEASVRAAGALAWAYSSQIPTPRVVGPRPGLQPRQPRSQIRPWRAMVTLAVAAPRGFAHQGS
jgi:hypothetical protein